VAHRRREKPTPPVCASHEPRGFAATVARYLEWMQLQNYSPRTVETRRVNLDFFFTWAHERGLRQPNEVTKPVLDRYKKWLYYRRKKDGQPLSFRSQHNRLVAVRAYFKWLARNNHILFNPASELELPRLEQRLPKHVLTAAEVETVLALPDTRDPLGLRDRAILETLYSTAIRRLSLIQLAVWDVDAERGLLRVRQAKGKKGYVVPIGERALAWVEKYRLDVRPLYSRDPDDGTLFLTNLGERFGAARMSQLVRRYVNRADLGKTGSCHLFRHTAATLLLEAGMDIRHLQVLLNHERLDTTQIYTQVAISDLKRLHSALHPAASLQRIPQVAPKQGEGLTPEDVLEALEEETREEDASG
jgi:integrase/recombinase XerD